MSDIARSNKQWRIRQSSRPNTNLGKGASRRSNYGPTIGWKLVQQFQSAGEWHYSLQVFYLLPFYLPIFRLMV